MRTRPSLAAAPTLALALLFAPRARAASDSTTTAETSGGFAAAAEGFGGAGQLALSLGATADEHFFLHKSGGAWQFQLAPAADYFIIPHVSVGGVIAYAHGSGGAGTGTNGLGSDRFAIAARAGYVFAINDMFGVWPLAGLRLDYLSQNHASATNTWFTLYAPFLFHPAPHFFVGLGPSFQFHLSGLASSEYGFDSMLGGWF